MKEELVLELLGVSDGTLATLTRETHYDVLEAVRHTWYAWTLEAVRAGAEFFTWQAAWHAWLREYEPEPVTGDYGTCLLCHHRKARSNWFCKPCFEEARNSRAFANLMTAGHEVEAGRGTR